MQNLTALTLINDAETLVNAVIRNTAMTCNRIIFEVYDIIDEKRERFRAAPPIFTIELHTAELEFRPFASLHFYFTDGTSYSLEYVFVPENTKLAREIVPLGLMFNERNVSNLNCANIADLIIREVNNKLAKKD